MAKGKKRKREWHANQVFRTLFKKLDSLSNQQLSTNLKKFYVRLPIFSVFFSSKKFGELKQTYFFAISDLIMLDMWWHFLNRLEKV